MSYLRASSQWGSAPSGSFTSGPPILTTSLSSAPLPGLTRLHGVLGISTSWRSSSAAASSIWARSSPERALSAATSALAASAASRSPCFIRLPISAAFCFCCASSASLSVWRLRRRASSSSTLSTIGCASKFLIFNFSTTAFGSSRSILSVNIFLLCKLKGPIHLSRSAGSLDSTKCPFETSSQTGPPTRRICSPACG